MKLSFALANKLADFSQDKEGDNPYKSVVSLEEFEKLNETSLVQYGNGFISPAEDVCRHCKAYGLDEISGEIIYIKEGEITYKAIGDDYLENTMDVIKLHLPIPMTSEEMEKVKKKVYKVGRGPTPT